MLRLCKYVGTVCFQNARNNKVEAKKKKKKRSTEALQKTYGSLYSLVKRRMTNETQFFSGFNIRISRH